MMANLDDKLDVIFQRHGGWMIVLWIVLGLVLFFIE